VDQHVDTTEHPRQHRIAQVRPDELELGGRHGRRLPIDADDPRDRRVDVQPSHDCPANSAAHPGDRERRHVDDLPLALLELKADDLPLALLEVKADDLPLALPSRMAGATLLTSYGNDLLAAKGQPLGSMPHGAAVGLP
jgi:hypothetical protein